MAKPSSSSPAGSGESGEPGPSQIVLPSSTLVRALVQRMQLEATIEDGERDFAVFEQGLDKILTAETEAEMWDADDLTQTGGRDLRDVEQLLIDYQIKKSRNPDIKSMFRADDGRFMFLLLRSARLADGEEFVWNTSAPYLVGKVLWLADHEKLPAEVVIRGIDLGGGQTVLKLKPVPKRAYRQEPVL